MKRIAAILLSVVLLLTLVSSGISANAASRIKPRNPSKAKLHFALWADPQVSDYLTAREPFLISSAADIRNNCANKPDALVIAGDITENGLADEWAWVYDDIKDIGVKNYITATGNHDIRLHTYSDAVDAFTAFTNRLNKNAGSKLKISKLHYSYTVNGYTFIVLGSDISTLEEAELHTAQLKWLNRELKKAAKQFKPVFVVAHQPLKNTHGLPDTWGSSSKTAGSVGPQSAELKRIFNRYGNVIYITGHLHSGFGKYTYQRVGNFHCINLPSLGVENSYGSYNENGIGYMAEVYPNKVLFRARNFDQGVYVPKYDISVNLYIGKVKLSKTKYRYDGKKKTPKVTVYDAYGRKLGKKQYKVTYSKGRKKAGKYRLKVTFKGKYKKAPPVTKTFRIVK